MIVASPAADARARTIRPAAGIHPARRDLTIELTAWVFCKRTTAENAYARLAERWGGVREAAGIASQ